MVEPFSEKDQLKNFVPQIAKYFWEKNKKIGLYESQGAHRWLVPAEHLWLYIDFDRCIGCFACETACKLEHDLPMGIRHIRVMQVGPKKVGKRIKTIYYPMACFHCGRAPCVEACPTGAMRKRTDNGIVYVDKDACIGCKQCMQACPFGAVQYDSRFGKVTKCNYCMHRIDKGLMPACVVKCPGVAMIFGNPEDVTTYIRDKRARQVATEYFGGRDFDLLSGPAYVWPEKQLLLPRIELRPGALMERPGPAKPVYKKKE